MIFYNFRSPRVPAQLEIKCVFVIIQTHTGDREAVNEIADPFPALVQREPALRTRRAA